MSGEALTHFIWSREPPMTRLVEAADLPRDLRITRAVGFRITSRRSKIAGKNARLDVHGDQATERKGEKFVLESSMFSARRALSAG